jgi:hypothetical protein
MSFYQINSQDIRKLEINCKFPWLIASIYLINYKEKQWIRQYPEANSLYKSIGNPLGNITISLTARFSRLSILLIVLYPSVKSCDKYYLHASSSIYRNRITQSFCITYGQLTEQCLGKKQQITNTETDFKYTWKIMFGNHYFFLSKTNSMFE